MRLGNARVRAIASCRTLALLSPLSVWVDGSWLQRKASSYENITMGNVFRHTLIYLHLSFIPARP